MNYTYDGTFEGFLSLIYYLFEIKSYKVNIEREDKKNLFQGEYIETSNEKSKRVYSKLLKVITAYELESIYTAFLSERYGIENTIFSYIIRVIKNKKSLARDYSSEIEIINKVSYKICRESHKFKGFIRFRKLIDGTYYSIIKPEGNVLPLIQEHFEERFSDQNFIIHDITRGVALVYLKEERRSYTSKLTEPNKELLEYQEDSRYLHNEESGYIDLWRTFFESISIEGRKNPRCQRNFMPQKYWENMVEVNKK